MPPVVVIPWRPGCPHRQRAFDWVTASYRSAGYEVVVGQHLDGRWCKALAVADALTRTTADTLVIADADCWLPDPQALPAAIGALDSHGWAVPHGDVHRLDQPATDQLITTGQAGGGRDQKPYLGFAGGGAVVIRRDAYQEAPMDRRFAGWGQEDESWAVALRTLVGVPWRGRADLLHLWHPYPERLNRRTGSEAGAVLMRRYRSAAHRPERMRALIQEAT